MTKKEIIRINKYSGKEEIVTEQIFRDLIRHSVDNIDLAIEQLYKGIPQKSSYAIYKINYNQNCKIK